jgi:hypothetical protein
MTIGLRKVLDALFNFVGGGQAPAAATETIVSGSQIVLTAPLYVGQKFRWRVVMTKTAAGTGNSAFLIKSNTSAVVATGTTGGAATLATLTFPTAETAAVGSAYVDIEAIVTAISATVGGVCAKLTAVSTAAAATGFSNQTVAAIAANLVTDGTIQSIGLAITSGAADAVTINFAEGSSVAP